MVHPDWNLPRGCSCNLGVLVAGQDRRHIRRVGANGDPHSRRVWVPAEMGLALQEEIKILAALFRRAADSLCDPCADIFAWALVYHAAGRCGVSRGYGACYFHVLGYERGILSAANDGQRHSLGGYVSHAFFDDLWSRLAIERPRSIQFL